MFENTEAYCDNCEKYTPLEVEELHPPLPDDTRNIGYLFGDLICLECYSIHTTIRQKAGGNGG